jgi:hypothetical protein
VCNLQVNHNLPGFATPSLLTTPSSAGKYHHVEPPSYQRSCLNYTSNWPEEEKASLISSKLLASFVNVSNRREKIKLVNK